MTFVEFVERNHDSIMEVLYQFSTTMGDKMKEADHRMDISCYFQHILFEQFTRGSEGCQFETKRAVGFDMAYGDDRVSIKIAKEIFSRRYKRNPSKRTNPQTLVMKNTLGGGNIDLEFDYLFAVERAEKDTPRIKFGVVGRATVVNNLQVNSSDQIKARIPDNEWLFLSESVNIEKNQFVDPAVVDDVYSDGRYNMFTAMAKLYKKEQKLNGYK